jgi:glucose-6-phosphate dehydrogenase assembly protein OpcA
MIEDVLLTTTEILDLIQNATHEELFSEGLMYDKMHKAQCLKLLGWLSERCTEHPIVRESGTGYRRRWACPQCDAELRKQLEGGR